MSRRSGTNGPPGGGQPSRSPLLLPPLLEALETWQRGRGDAERELVRAALGELAGRLELHGLRIAVDAPPLVPLSVGWGSLAEMEGGTRVELRTHATGPALGLVWVDAPRSAATVPAVQAASLAVQTTRDAERAARAEGHLAALDAAVRGIAGVLEVDRVLQLIVDRVAELVDARYAALGIVEEGGARIERFITTGVTPEERARIGHPPRGHGLLGLIIREGSSFRIPDLAVDPRRYGFPPNHPEMHAFLGVPVRVGDRVIGNLYLTEKRGAAEFSADDQRLVERFAVHAGLAMETARLSDRARRLSLVEERERIGHDLHDSVIQRIYGVTLALDDVPELVEEHSPEAAERVDRAIDDLHAAINEIRSFIFGLQPVSLEEGGMLGALGMLADELRRNTAVEVEVRGQEPPPLPVETAAELLAITREALSNVARHAGASRATVELTMDAHDALRLEIADDGRGFDPAAPPNPSGYGLASLVKRAERLRGKLRIESSSGLGTRIIVTVGLPRGHEEPEPTSR